MSQGISNEDLYKLMDVLSINDASALIAGVNPTDVYYNFDSEQYDSPPYVLSDGLQDAPQNARTAFEISRKAIMNAVISAKLKSDNIAVLQSHEKLVKADLKTDWIATHGIDTKETTIYRDDLRAWLEDRGVYPPLLFPNGKKDDYMNPNHANYSAKLAVCVRAWEVAQTSYINDQTIKQFMENWIKENGSMYKLPKLNKTGIAELAAISNWDKSGTKIKGGIKPSLTLPSENDTNTQFSSTTVHQKLKSNLPDNPLPYDDDADIPF